MKKTKKFQKNRRVNTAPHGGGRRAWGEGWESRASRYGTREEKEGEAIFRGTSRGYGFCEVIGEGGPREDIFIPASDTRGAIDGDRVRITYHSYLSRRDGDRVRYEGEVTSILEAVRQSAIGTLISERVSFGRRSGRMWYLLPDDGRLPTPILLADSGGGSEGEKVEAMLGRRSSAGLHGQVSRIFGAADDRRANYEAILAACEIPTAFPADVLREAEERAEAPLSPEGRERHENEVIFTIDGAGAKDLDDAVSLRLLPHGRYLLGVHIADVSEYVTAGSALDREATARGTSVYFTDKVVPMLPEALSNGACSLNAGEDKYALSAYMTLDSTGEILSTRIKRGIIRSRVRGVYSEINDLFAKEKQSEFYPKYRAVYPTLGKMQALYRLLAARARARGAIDFDRAEAEILLDAAGEPREILLRERGDAERMIEQFMLTANEGVARLMTEKGFPCVYRVHEKPDPVRLDDFILYAHNLGLDTRPLTLCDVDCASFSRVLDEAAEKGVKEAVSYAMLRTMAKAEYSEKAAGHFGLGIKLYCHFTSPIRRLSDLATHRIIKAVLLDGEKPGKYASYAKRAAEAASEGELRALDAERQIETLYKTIFMKKHEGEIFDAKISSVASFGLFAELPNTCEGLIPIADLGEGFIFEEKSLRLSRGAENYAVGDALRIRVEEADIATRKVRFSLAEGTRVLQDQEDATKKPSFAQEEKNGRPGAKKQDRRQSKPHGERQDPRSAGRPIHGKGIRPSDRKPPKKKNARGKKGGKR